MRARRIPHEEMRRASVVLSFFLPFRNSELKLPERAVGTRWFVIPFRMVSAFGCCSDHCEKTMTREISALILVTALLAVSSASLRAQAPLQVATEHAHRAGRYADDHAGIHSGSWTLKGEQILEAESKDEHRSCRDPHCNRCSKHLADYGHEYQYITGPSQRQRWYRGTAGTIAPVTQRGYDQHGLPYVRRGQPGAVMSWEYQRVLNHAIWEQVQARNAVAAEEAAEDRHILLTELHGVALGLLEQSEARWNELKDTCTDCGENTREYCVAKAQYEKDCKYVVAVERELTAAKRTWEKLASIANEKVRVALLSKDDADRATHFKRIQHKPAKYQEVLAARETETEQQEVQSTERPEEP